jgi:hypothetical protein
MTEKQVRLGIDGKPLVGSVFCEACPCNELCGFAEREKPLINTALDGLTKSATDYITEVLLLYGVGVADQVIGIDVLDGVLCVLLTVEGDEHYWWAKIGAGGCSVGRCDASPEAIRHFPHHKPIFDHPGRRLMG